MAQIAYVNWDGLVYYDSKIKDYIKDKLEECIKFQGLAKRDQLPDPSYETLNFMYILSEQIVSDTDFKTPGLTYPAGTIVQVIDYDNVYLYDSIFTNGSGGAGVDLSGYVTHEELESYVVTEDDVKEIVENIHIPGLDTSGLVSRIEFEEVTLNKADTVQFTKDYRVTKPIGGFKVGDQVWHTRLDDLLIKLLGLELVTEPDPEPDIPTEPGTIPEIIITNKYPMYQINENGEVIEITYVYEKFTETEAASAPSKDCFYQIKDGEKVVESGYQHISEENDSMYYLVLLPKELDFNTNVSVQYWDNGNNVWKHAVIEMSNDLAFIEEALAEGEMELPVYDSDKYTLWIDASLETCAGTDYRFIINE